MVCAAAKPPRRRRPLARLLAWLANEKLVRAAYLSLTRGDGGQNLIGSEQGPLLGLIRTQELLAARRVDGAEQRFTRARDEAYIVDSGNATASGRCLSIDPSYS